MTLRGSLALAGLLLLAAQMFLLPPEGWVTGDQGSKYLQTRAFATNGPLDPAIDVLARDLDPGYHFQEPKLANRRGRLVSEFLWLLPLLSAPFYWLFGLRGLYVVPAISVGVVVVAAAALARRLGGGTGVHAAWIAVLVTPMFVYGLEFWEHAPAVACVMIAAALAYPSGDDRADRRRLIGAGAAIVAGALFREEAAVALPALVIARAGAVRHDRIRTLIAGGWWMAAGAAVVFAASVPVNLLIYGSALPMHVTHDAWDVATASPYLNVRRELVVRLVLPLSHAAVFMGAVTAGIVATAVQTWRRRGDRATRDDRITRVLLAVIHAAAAVMLIVGVALPIWNMATGMRGNEAYRVTSAAHTWTFAAALLYWPWYRDALDGAAARYLLVAGASIAALTFGLVPTDGGSQWSPRFFLAAAPLLAIPIATALMVTRNGGAVGRLTVPHAVVGAIFAASIAMQVTGIGWVQRSKARNARLTAWIAARTAPGDVLISDVFWFHEVTATLAATRRQLFSWSAADVPAMAARAAGRGFRRFWLITSPELTGYQAPAMLDVPGSRCRFASGPPMALGELLVREYNCEGN